MGNRCNIWCCTYGNCGGLGISPGMTAAAVICGAIFGDKMSPISDTVNLSAGTCEVNIFDNIKSVATATIPGFILNHYSIHFF